MLSSSIGTEAIKVWDTQSWQQVCTLPGLSGTSLIAPRMLSDGSTIVVEGVERRTGNRRMRVWQSASWEEITVAEAAQKPHPITQ